MAGAKYTVKQVSGTLVGGKKWAVMKGNRRVATFDTQDQAREYARKKRGGESSLKPRRKKKPQGRWV